MHKQQIDKQATRFTLAIVATYFAAFVLTLPSPLRVSFCTITTTCAHAIKNQSMQITIRANKSSAIHLFLLPT